MKLLITENKFKDILKLSIKDLGIQSTIDNVGGWENFCKVLNIESPMDFLHLFDDLKQAQSEERKDLILFRYKPNYNLMIYVTENETVYIDYNEIWSFLEDKFGLSYEETRAFTKKWLDNVYNFRGITTNQFQDAYHSRIG